MTKIEIFNKAVNIFVDRLLKFIYTDINEG